MNRIIGLDVARALAIGLVVLSYIHYRSQAIGIYGVELFFALSGFLIGTILFRCLPEEGKWTLAGVTNFWKRRWWRTLPNYYLFLLIAIAFYHGQDQWPAEGATGILPYFIFSQNLISPNEPFFSISWSLCVEEMFYLFFPLLVLLFHRTTGSRIGAFAIAGAVVFLSSAALREIIFSQYLSADARVATFPRLDAIGYGVALAVITQVVDLSISKRKILAVSGVVLLGVTITLHVIVPVNEVTWFFRAALITIPLSFSLTMPLLASWTSLPRALKSLRSPITAVSQWSYSIYLSHAMIIAGTYSLFGSLRDIPAVNLGSKLVGLVLTLLVSRWVFVHFETRFTALRPDEKHFAAPESSKAEMEKTAASSARA